MVTKLDIEKALSELGIGKDDHLIIHSSLKSFGKVENGAETVIDAVIEYLSEGTVVFPTLRVNDFFNAYKNWDIKNTPSDVGLITETFRKRSGVVRSDQETHSVCALGKKANYITEGHRTGKSRIGVFGDYAFCFTSPYDRLYELNGKVLLIGVNFNRNTINHLAEYRLVSDILKSIEDEKVKKQAYEQVCRFEDTCKIWQGGTWDNKMWPYLDPNKAQEDFEKRGKIRHTTCGNSQFLCFNIKEYVDFAYQGIKDNPDEWLHDDNYQGAVLWVKKYRKYLK